MEQDKEKVRLQDRQFQQNTGFGGQLLWYTVIFVFAALGAYMLFIIGGSTFLKGAAGGNKDGLAQIYPSYVAVKHLVQGLLAGDGFSAWNWSIGLGGDNWNMFASKLANPFTYLIIAVPDKYIDISYTLVAVFKQYCTGLAFMFFGRKMGLDGRQNVMGGICYAFSMWMMLTVTAQSGFDTAAILFPLLVLGTEKIRREESPLLFIVTVFFLMTSGVIWGYASGIMIIFYYFLSSVLLGDLKDMKKFGKVTGVYMISGIAGLLLASAFIASILISMTSATTDTGSGKDTWFTMRQYLAVPIALFKAMQTGAPSYSAIGLPIIGVILMPLIVPGLFRKKPQSFMAVLCLIGTQIPAVCRLFNGLSYPSGRWFYMVAFFLTWAAIENLSEETFRSGWKCLVMEIWLLLTAGWTIVSYYPIGMMDKKTAFTGIAGLIFGTFIIIVGYIKAKEFRNPGKFVNLIKKTAVVLIALTVIADIAEIKFMSTFTHALDGVPGYTKVGEAYAGIMETPETAIPEIQAEDTGFYRTDQVGGYFGIRTSGAKVNENIMFGTRSIYTCFSSAPSAWHDYNKVVGNVQGNYRRTLICSNDNRPMLDYLEGVKYFVGRASESAGKKHHGSLYVPYGYEKMGEVGGYEVYKNKYCMGLGTTYDRYITESEFAEFPIVLREQVLMQAAVVPDSYAEKGKLGDAKHITKKEIETAIKEVDYKIAADENCEIDTKAKQITVYNLTEIVDGFEVKDEAKLHLTLPEIKNSQVILAFENFNRRDMTYEDTAMLFTGKVPEWEDQGFLAKVRRRSFKDTPGFKLRVKVQDGGRKKAAKCEEGGVRSFNDLDTYDINLGYYEKLSGDLTLTLNNPGYYTYDAIKVYAIPMDGYEKNAAKLDAASYKIDEWSGDYVTGTVDNEKAGVMYFSILKNMGWHIYIDGKKAEKIKDVNFSFIGAAVPAGEHKVELRYEYPYFKVIIAATILGVILTLIILIRYHSGKKQRSGMNTDPENKHNSGKKEKYIAKH